MKAWLSRISTTPVVSTYYNPYEKGCKMLKELLQLVLDFINEMKQKSYDARLHPTWIEKRKIAW